MIQEDKELLLKDLCARLPYGVKVEYNKCACEVRSIDRLHEELTIWKRHGYYHDVKIEDCKPYLFPMSSMTDEQKQEFLSVAGYERREDDCGRHTETYYYDMVGHEHNFYPNIDAIEWLNKKHFDYRGLIEKGLAIDATGLNIY